VPPSRSNLGTQFVAQKDAAQIKAIKNPAIESRWSAESRNNEGESAGEGRAPAR
jgi:hypothetical protein